MDAWKGKNLNIPFGFMQIMTFRRVGKKLEKLCKMDAKMTSKSIKNGALGALWSTFWPLGGILEGGEKSLIF